MTLPASLTRLIHERKSQEEIPGIGEDRAGIITSLVTTGSLPLLGEFPSQVPAGLRGIMAVPGLGPKRAKALYEG